MCVCVCGVHGARADPVAAPVSPESAEEIACQTGRDKYIIIFTTTHVKKTVGGGSFLYSRSRNMVYDFRGSAVFRYSTNVYT